MSSRILVNWFIGLALIIAFPAYAAPPAGTQRIIDGSYIVVFKPGVDTDVAGNDLMQRFAGMAEQFRYRYALRGMAVRLSDRRMENLRKDPRVAYIEPDVVMSVAAQILPTGIDRINAELDSTANIDNVDDRVDVDIAILDTGIDLNHPDLNLYSYAYCKQQGGGPFSPYNCIENDTGADDGNSHGTHVAGTAAALDNTSGVVGVAPGARLWSVKVLENDGNGTLGQVLAGVDYVTANASAIDVANMSLTGSGSVQSLDDAISNAITAGVTIVLAAGNDRLNVSQVFPAGHPSAITVSALSDFDGVPGGAGSLSLSFSSCVENVDDSFACFSNFGSGVDIMAPGVQIRSTVPGGGTGNKSGTSMAAPHVAGAAALYLAQNPGAAPAIVKDALLAGGSLTPCANSGDGTCADDPDGIQEPFLLLADSIADGDLNLDGQVDVRDYLLGLQVLQGQVQLTAEQLSHGDVAPISGGVSVPNGQFNTGDLLLIQRAVLGDLTLPGS